MNRPIKRSIRMPKDDLELLRGIRDSYPSSSMNLSTLFDKALRSSFTNGVAPDDIELPTTRDNSEAITVFVEERYQEMPAKEVAKRVHAVLEIQKPQVNHAQVELKRGSAV